MKKLLSIALALVLALALTVNVFADEVIYSEDLMFFKIGSWESYPLEITTEDFIEALKTPGAYVVITRSAPSDITEWVDGLYEKFCMTDSWYSLNLGADSKGETINHVRMGTKGHTIADAGNEDVAVDCVYDDGVKVWYNAADLLPLWEVWTPGSSELLLISNTSSTAYEVANFSIVVPDEVPGGAAEAPVEETPAVEDTPAVEETPAVEDTSEAPAETGLALAIVPMIVALAAVVASKKR